MFFTTPALFNAHSRASSLSYRIIQLFTLVITCARRVYTNSSSMSTNDLGKDQQLQGETTGGKNSLVVAKWSSERRQIGLVKKSHSTVRVSNDLNLWLPSGCHVTYSALAYKAIKIVSNLMAGRACCISLSRSVL